MIIELSRNLNKVLKIEPFSSLSSISSNKSTDGVNYSTIPSILMPSREKISKKLKSGVIKLPRFLDIVYRGAKDMRIIAVHKEVLDYANISKEKG